MYQQGGTVKSALDRIASNEYVLPAIQREFVWSPEQICKLFDSVMQGYPFGEFLFWRIEPARSGDYRYYGFVREYHQRDSPHCPDLGPLPNHQVIAVLDGQQRLTAFNIGLRGSMSVKLPYKRWNNPEAFPRQFLALDLLAPNERDEEGSCYVFDFVEEASIGRQGERLWFKVPDIVSMASGPEMHDWLLGWDLEREEQSRAFHILDRLHRVVHTEPTVAYYEERNQDIEHVLNIFIRRNSGGTVLSYSDLLLSIATSQWRVLDARREVHQLVDDLNRIGAGLGLTKDFVLKAGLMLTDIASVGFQVRNFTQANMAILEEKWQGIRDSLVEAVQLVAGFGFDGNSIGRATSALLPIAYYLLTALREVIREAGGDGFPSGQMRRLMAQRGKSLEFSEEEVEDLADMSYSDRRVFALLALLCIASVRQATSTRMQRTRRIAKRYEGGSFARS